MSDWRAQPHRRYNPLRGDWVLVSPHRLDRPWQGAQTPVETQTRPIYDAHCYLCPGNQRANGAQNPRYEQTFVFENDFAALLPQTPPEEYCDGLLAARGESGRARVVCFSSRHDLDIAQMDEEAITRVVDVWAQHYVELGSMPEIGAVTIFENRGAAMGASNPHPHGQIWAQRELPTELDRECIAQRAYRERTGTCLLCSYLEQEIAQAQRVVFADEEIVVLVPFWATWPFEALVLPRRHAASLDRLVPQQRSAFARGMRELTSRYDRLFATPFPYSMGVHQAPTDAMPHDEWHVHAHYYPPLLRSASVRKYLVGYEMLGEAQRDLTAEAAAERLRSA